MKRNGHFERIKMKTILIMSGGIRLSNKDDRRQEDKETWRIWDAVFFSSMFSILKDNEDAQKDDKKFKQLLYQLLFSVAFVAIVFVIALWIVKN